MTDPTTRALIHLESSPDGLTTYPVAMLPNTPEWGLVGREVIVTMLPAPPAPPATVADTALYDFLDALVLAKHNDDVMSVVDAMLATYTEIAGHLHERQPGPCSLCDAPTTRPDQMDVCDECYGADHARHSTTPGRLACQDGGTCHHDCGTRDKCWRVDHAEPLSGVYPGDEWPT